MSKEDGMRNLAGPTYVQALDMFRKSCRLGREALAAREEVSRILGIQHDDYRRDCLDEAALEGFYADSEIGDAALFNDAIDLAGLKTT